jgi:hypothetical protein
MWHVLNDAVQHRYNLICKLKTEEDSGFTNSTTMKKCDFEILLRKTGPRNPRKDIKYCEAIPASIRLAVTLSYLASGDSFTSLLYTSKIYKISMIVPEVCEALIAVLKEYISHKKIYSIP